MAIHHIGIWVQDLEAAKQFYMHYFEMTSSERYESKRQPLKTYFLSAADCLGAKIELMERHDVAANQSEERGFTYGLAHIAISVGSELQVDAITNRLRHDGFSVISEPRTTGDGFYESIVADLEGNWIEITV